MENPVRISVIIPVFNNLAGIIRTLEGISEQSLSAESFEVIVVDNACEEPLNVQSAYMFSLRIIQCETPGSYAARNAGARESRGQVLVFTDSDCVADSEWIENGVTALKERKEDAVVGGEVRFVAPATSTATSLYQTIVGFQQRDNIERRGFSATANLFCTRSAFDSVGPFNERLLSGGDREWCWRAQMKGFSVIFAPEAIVNTSPRSTLGSAIRQARRVTAGRLHLAGVEAAFIPKNGLKRHRSMFESFYWLLRHPDLRTSERVRVLAVASLIRASVLMERMRLHLGGLAERR